MMQQLVMIFLPATSALLATPALTSFHTPLPNSAVKMSLQSRRAVLAGAIAAVPLAASASFTSDKAELAKEDAEIAALDSEIKKERNLAFQDELALSKTNDEILAALKKGDKKKAEELRAKLKVLEARYSAEEKEVQLLTGEESKELALEKQTKAKVAADAKAELALENRELIEGEEAALKATVGAETANVISKYLK